ncbi:hypothetical protein FOT81_27260, partial [Raoultella planticola]|uniref:hypothetical protein n=1 Tax=Raoultella planticola TaxID=575 RepID=UPI001786B636
MNYYKIAKGTESYEYLYKIKNRDVKNIFNKVSELIGFEANGNVVLNRSYLSIRKSELEKNKPEWLKDFKRDSGEWVTPKVAQKKLIFAYAEIRKKYDMDYSFNDFCFMKCLCCSAEVFHDFDNY